MNLLKTNENKLENYILKMAKKYKEANKEDRVKVGQRVNCCTD